jgi:hypothetical protein
MILGFCGLGFLPIDERAAHHVSPDTRPSGDSETCLRAVVSFVDEGSHGLELVSSYLYDSSSGFGGINHVGRCAAERNRRFLIARARQRRKR